MKAKPRVALSGRTVTFTVSVKDLVRRGGTPTGDVTVMEGTAILGTAALRRGKARIKSSRLPVGRDTIQVVYSGSPVFAPSMATVTEIVRLPHSKG